MGYIPYNPALYSNHDVHTDPKTGLAMWIACHVLPLLVMLASFVYNKIKREWSTYDLPAMFEFFAIWLASVVLIDLLVFITYLIMSLL